MLDMMHDSIDVDGLMHHEDMKRTNQRANVSVLHLFLLVHASKHEILDTRFGRTLYFRRPCGGTSVVQRVAVG